RRLSGALIRASPASAVASPARIPLLGLPDVFDPGGALPASATWLVGDGSRADRQHHPRDFGPRCCRHALLCRRYSVARFVARAQEKDASKCFWSDAQASAVAFAAVA